MTKTKATSSKVKFAIVGLVIGLLLGVISTIFVLNFNPADKDSDRSPSIVFDRIIAQDELVCASQKYNITDKATDANTFYDLFEIPFTKNSFWYRYVGTIKVGIDLRKASYTKNGNVIAIELEHPYIISNTPNMDESGCLEENNNIFNPIHVEDVDAFQQQCIEKSEAEIVQGGIIDEVRENAERNIRDMFYAALGDAYTIEFQWKGDE